MIILYLIQTHKNPEQIYRLVQTLKTSPNSRILISHDFTACSLDLQPLDLPEVYVIRKEASGVRGDFSLVQAYLDAVSWLFTHNINFDWLINLSGQDYPTQPLALFEQFLAQTDFDGFLQYSDVLSEHSCFGREESQKRYFYQYWHSGVQLNKWQRGLLKPFRVLINNVQSILKIDYSYQFSVGVRAYNNPFSQNFVCYGGSYFKVLSQKCVRYLHDTLSRNCELINYYKNTHNSDESLMQTVLVNSNLFYFCNDSKFYIDWHNTQHGHPRVLTVKDYSSLINKDTYFARKFDTNQDSKILDMLDAKIFLDTYLPNYPTKAQST